MFLILKIDYNYKVFFIGIVNFEIENNFKKNYII